MRDVAPIPRRIADPAPRCAASLANSSPASASAALATIAAGLVGGYGLLNSYSLAQMVGYRSLIVDGYDRRRGLRQHKFGASV
jgi:hypothetical protein